jgi:hypothetical protein
MLDILIKMLDILIKMLDIPQTKIPKIILLLINPTCLVPVFKPTDDEARESSRSKIN